ncbi:MAG: hypothetical protein L3J04_04540 [Robiginitomaculum sp.]|nr:hypothetical protein [Robiginitomaculum sp.]
MLNIYNDVYEALCVKASLEAAGLYALVPDYHTSSTNWAGGVTLGNVRLLVLETELQAAHEITDQQQLPASEAAAPCPKCSSTKTSQMVSLLEVAIAIILLIPAIRRTKHFICHDCKNRWKYERS